MHGLCYCAELANPSQQKGSAFGNTQKEKQWSLTYSPCTGYKETILLGLLKKTL
ncbi:rCG63152, partial [Rattus norvegicus]